MQRLNFLFDDKFMVFDVIVKLESHKINTLGKAG